MKPFGTPMRILLAVAMLACFAPSFAWTVSKSVAYYITGEGQRYAYLVDWKGRGKARVVNPDEARSGVVTDDGIQRVVTLNAPFSSVISTYDACDIAIEQRRDVNQLVVRETDGGLAQIATIGTLTNIGGCQDGLVTPFGSIDDPGATMKRLALDRRPAMDDVVPGLQIAGPSEMAAGPGYANDQDVVTLNDSSVMFHRTGHSFPATVTADSWLTVSLPGGLRSYTRLEIDSKTGGEVWMLAELTAGEISQVETALFVKPQVGAGFGSVKAASRMWQSGMFVESRTPSFVYLYANGVGERVSKNLDGGTETRSPITSWSLVDYGVAMSRPFGSGRAERSWLPLRNTGKARWVMESEIVYDAPDSYTFIPPRVNYYIDTGKALSPVQASASSRVH